MRIKLSIAVYQSKALFTGFYCPLSNCNFIKGSQFIKEDLAAAIPDSLDDSRCGSFSQNISREKQE